LIGNIRTNIFFFLRRARARHHFFSASKKKWPKNASGKIATHVLSRLTIDVRFPVLFLESPTLGRERMFLLEIHAIFGNKDDAVGLITF